MSKPLIFDYKNELSERKHLPVYTYDYLMNLNVVTINGVKIPFIDSPEEALEMATKTRTRQEVDDEPPRLEMETKTKIKNESDDHHHHFLVEMATKTLVKQETDDEENIINH